MIDHKHLNRKALHELILYYLREEIGKKNRTIQHLIITDGYNWFLFEKKTFLELFANSKKFANEVMTLDNSSDYKTKLRWQNKRTRLHIHILISSNRETLS